MTSNPSLVEKCSSIPGMSDHDAIPVIILNTKPKKNKQKPCKIFLYKKANISELCNEVSKISEDFIKKDINSTTTECLWNEFKERVHLAVSNNIPTKMVYGNGLTRS